MLHIAKCVKGYEVNGDVMTDEGNNAEMYYYVGTLLGAISISLSIYSAFWYTYTDTNVNGSIKDTVKSVVKKAKKKIVKAEAKKAKAASSKEALAQISEYSEAGITVRGQFTVWRKYKLLHKL